MDATQIRLCRTAQDTDFAALVQFELAQALTADEGVPTIADTGADVKPMPG